MIRHISWTPQFHTWTPTEILLRSQETRGSFILNVLFKSIFSRQMSRRLGNLERDWPTGSPVTHAQSFFSSVVVAPLSFLRSISLASLFVIVLFLADQVFYRSYVYRQHFRLRSFASLSFSRVELVLIQTSLLLLCKTCCYDAN